MRKEVLPLADVEESVESVESVRVERLDLALEQWLGAAGLGAGTLL